MCVAEERIEAVETRIAMNDYETAVAFDTDGNAVFERKGDAKNVPYTHEEFLKLKGYTLTHNHAFNIDWKYFGMKNTSALSSDDIWIAYKYGVIETRMVIGNERHSFRWNNPDEYKARIFVYELGLLEDETNTVTEILKEKDENAIEIAIEEPTQENDDNMDRLVYEFYKAQEKQANTINEFLENNQHVGYVFRKERVQ
jgi:hypothetical protein